MQSEMSGSNAPGLFRHVFGGREGTVASAFRALGRDASLPHQVEPLLNARQVRVDLPPQEGAGYWRFISIGEGIFVVVTDCNYAGARHERVIGEGLVEFHFILEGPVELTLPREADWSPAGISMMVCHQKPGTTYDVWCLPGAFRMISVYVRPDILTGSFGFGAQKGSASRQLLDAAENTLSIIEQKIDLDVVRILQTLFQIETMDRRDLALAAAKTLELLHASTTLLERRRQENEASVVFSSRELAMFERAREILGTDFSSQTIPDLARMLGTNSTKLKSGFKLLYGTTMFDYRNRSRMQRAMELLVEERMPVSAVAQAVGFRHQASFTSAFRAYYGFAPKVARRMVQQDAKPAGMASEEVQAGLA